MKIIFSAIVLFFTVQDFWAQQAPRQTLNGKIKLDHAIVEDISIQNLQTNKSTATVNGGYFTIQAKAGDTLMFSAIHIIGKQIIISEEDLTRDLLFVPLQPIPNQLEEVKVFRYDHINAVSLGIIPAGQRSYSAAERRYKAGGDLDAKIGTNSSISTDAVINWMSGKTAMLKKELAVERKESLQEKLQQMFDDSYVVNRLQIPSEYIAGFFVYVAGESASAAIFNSKDRTAAAFAIADLAVRYKKIIAGESD